MLQLPWEARSSPAQTTMTKEQERNRVMDTDQNASASRTGTPGEAHAAARAPEPLLFLDFDLAIPAEELRETIAAWSSYISRLEQAPAQRTTHDLILPARLRRGAAYSVLGECEQAIQDLRWVLDIGGDLAFSRTATGLLGSVYCEQGHYELAIECWSRLLEEWEQSTARKPGKLPARLPLLYLYRGMLLARQERFREAVADCTRAAEHFPDYSEIYAVRGLARALLGEVDEGLVDCTRAIKLEPAEASWHQRRGVVQMKRGKYHHALEDFQRALQLDPAHEQARAGYLEANMRLLFQYITDAEREVAPETVSSLLEE